MAEKPSNVVLNFKMSGQVEYAKTVREINAIMNTAAKEYKNHVAAMGDDAKATDKLRAEKQKLGIQMDAAKKRTEMLRAQYDAMSKDTKTTTAQLTQMYGKLLDAEKAEMSLQKSLDKVNEGLSDQGASVREAKDELGKLANEMQLLESEQKKLASGFDLQNASLGENVSATEKVELAQKQLRSQMQLTDKVVRNLENQLDQAKKAYGENSREVNELETKLNQAKTKVASFSREMEQVENSSNKAERGLKGAKSALAALGGAVPAAAIGAVASSTKELSTDLARLKTNAEMTGRDMDIVNEAFKQTASISGEADSAVETLSNILASGFKDEQLSAVIDNINGAAIKFSDTLKTEGIADGIQETFATGKAIGQFGELLERSGVDLDAFNEKLSSASTEGERSNIILEQMSSLGLTDVLEKYQELNPEIAEANQAQVEQEIALAELGDTLRPLVTDVAKFTTGLIEWANENPRLTQGLAIAAAAIGALVSVAAVLAPIITAIGLASGGASIGIGALMTSLLPIIAIIAGVTLVIIGIIAVIKNWGEITDWLSEKWGAFKDFLGDLWDGIKNTAETVWNGIKNFFKEYWDELLMIITGPIGILVGLIIKNWDTIKEKTLGVWETIKTATSNTFNRVKNAIVAPIEKARDLVRAAIEKIKGFFDFKFTWPRIPMPRFTVKPDGWEIGDLLKGSIPVLDVKWNAKGGIFTQPTIFGASGGRLQGAGEAGPEGVIPLNDSTLGAIGRGIAATMNLGNQTANINLSVDLDGETIARKTVKYNLREFYNAQRSSDRGSGRR